MAAFNIYSPPSLRGFSNFSLSGNAPTSFSYFPPNPAPVFRSKTLKCRRTGFVVSVLKKLSDTESVAVSPDSDGVFPYDSGVYAIYDAGGDLQFIGVAQNLAASVLAYQKSAPEICCYVKVGVVEERDKDDLAGAWRSWLEEYIAATGKVPPRNKPGGSTSAKKQPTSKFDLKFTSGRHVKLTVPLEDLIHKLVNEKRVVAFIKGSRNAPSCPFSQRVVAILESQEIDYETVDVLDEEHNNGLKEALKKYSNWPEFPQIYVNGEFIGGCGILNSIHEKEMRDRVFSFLFLSNVERIQFGNRVDLLVSPPLH